MSRPAPHGPRRTPPARAARSRIDGATATLLVHAPPSRTVERRYVLDVVLGEWLGLRYELLADEAPFVSIGLAGDSRPRQVRMPDVLLGLPDDVWLSERSIPLPPLRTLPGLGDEAGPPVLFGRFDPGTDAPPGPGARAGAGATAEPHEVVALDVDVLGSAFFCLTRYEEVVDGIRDRHARFAGSTSLAARLGSLERPLVDEYVDVLRDGLCRLWPGIVRDRPSFTLRLTHDVDDAWATYGRPTAIVARAAIGDVVRRRDPALAARRLRAVLDARSGRIDRDPYETFDLLMATSERHGLASTFYVMARDGPRGVDASYRLSDPRVRQLLARIHARGHRLGLHASYDAYLSAEQIRSELDALRSASAGVGVEQESWGVRQHFLRFEAPATWRCQAAAGLVDDSTLGFADRIGFRAGTCRTFPVFDLRAGRPLALRERPLIAMDTTLLEYLDLGLDEAASRVRALVRTCRRHGGEATILYHNSKLTGPRERGRYRELVEELVGSG